MRLNLYDILQTVLNEGVNQHAVMDAIDNRYRAFIDYSDEDNNAPGQRLIEPYALGLTKAGNLALRAYQYQGATLRGIPKWKLFRLDRMTKWRPLRNSKFNLQPKDQGFNAPAYNEHGDNTMISVIDQVKFNKPSEESGLYQPELDKLRQQTDQLVNHSNAISMAQLKDMPQGPIRQRRNNVYTSQPNSQKYKEYQKNIDRSQRTADDTAKYWGDYDKATQEAQDASTLRHKDDEMDSIHGPINDFNREEDDYDDYLENNRSNI